MASPQGLLLKKLGPPVNPGERTGRLNIVQTGEDIPFKELIYDASKNGYPSDVVLVNSGELPNETHIYLWLITNDGLFLLKENHTNQYSQRGKMCHTNFFGAVKALQGGELFFYENHVEINFKSGRYGASDSIHAQAILEFFNLCGYTNVKIIF